MKFAWVLNLDAELELSRLEFEYVPRTKLVQQLETYGRGSLALLGPDDVLVEPAIRQRAGEFVGRAWCPTPRALARMAAARIAPEPHPAAAVLRRVNHRLFAHHAGGGLP